MRLPILSLFLTAAALLPGDIGATSERPSMVFQEPNHRCNPLPLHQLGRMP
jgi:hypothetical protein